MGSNQVAGLTGRYRITTLDNRGVGRPPLPPSGITIELMATRSTSRGATSAGSRGRHDRAEVPLSYPDRLRSLGLNGTYAKIDVRAHRQVDAWATIAKHAESPRVFYEQFLASIYPPRQATRTPASRRGSRSSSASNNR